MKGLVLEGGGAKGAFQIGAYRALKELDIKIDGVAGTSIGALNGALIAQGDEEKAHEVWTNISASRLFQLTEEQFEKFLKFDISSADIPFFLSKIKDLFKNKGLDVSMIKNLLHDLIDETKLRASSIDFGLVTYSLSTLKPFELFLNEIPFGEMIGYLMASASLPVFKLEKLDGNLFIDGGVFDNMPINLLIKNGYRDIIVIRTFGIGMYKKIIDPSVKVTYINPSEDLGGILDFDNKHANKNLSLGYYDTMKHFKNWKGSRFYIKPEPSDERAFSLLFNFSDEVVFDIGQIFGYNNIPAKRMLFEFIIPRIVDLLSLPKDSSYQDILIGICEEIAREINLDRFRLYSLDGFIKAITESYQPEKEKEKEKAKLNVHLQDFLKKNELLSKFVKDKIFREIASKIIQ